MIFQVIPVQKMFATDDLCRGRGAFTLQPGDPSVSGKIRRVELSSLSGLNGATLQLPNRLEEQITLFTENQIWYDSLAIAHQLSDENDPTLWNQLLEAVGLEEIVQELKSDLP